jgi:hypothetical protein
MTDVVTLADHERWRARFDRLLNAPVSRRPLKRAA